MVTFRHEVAFALATVGVASGTRAAMVTTPAATKVEYLERKAWVGTRIVHIPFDALSLSAIHFESRGGRS